MLVPNTDSYLILYSFMGSYIFFLSEANSFPSMCKNAMLVPNTGSYLILYSYMGSYIFFLSEANSFPSVCNCMWLWFQQNICLWPSSIPLVWLNMTHSCKGRLYCTCFLFPEPWCVKDNVNVLKLLFLWHCTLTQSILNKSLKNFYIIMDVLCVNVKVDNYSENFN